MPGSYTTTAKSGRTYERGLPRLFPDDPDEVTIPAPGADGGTAIVRVRPDDPVAEASYISVVLDGGAWSAMFNADRTPDGWRLESVDVGGRGLPDPPTADLAARALAALGDYAKALDDAWPLLRRLAREERAHDFGFGVFEIHLDERGRQVAPREGRWSPFTVRGDLSRSADDLDISVHGFFAGTDKGCTHSARWIAVRDPASGRWEIDTQHDSVRRGSSLVDCDRIPDPDANDERWRTVTAMLRVGLPAYLDRGAERLRAAERDMLSEREREVLEERNIARGNVRDFAAYRAARGRGLAGPTAERERDRGDGGEFAF